MRTKNILLFLCCILLTETVWSQVTISGVVMDQQGLPLVGANVYLADTYDGGSTQINGDFTFSTEKSGSQTLIVSFIGYEELKMDILLETNPQVFNLSLKEAINKIDGVVITAGSFEAGGETKSEVLKPLDIVTTAGATADIAGALNTLPGTQTVGEEGRLFVRGGDGYETKTFIDGLVAFKPYDTTVPNTPTRGRFSPFMFKGTSFSTGGYSAEYGQALSSTLNLVTKDKQSQTRTDFSLMSVGVEASQTYAGEKSSLAGKIGYYNMKPYYLLVPQTIDWLDQPETFEVNAAYRQKIANSGTLKAYMKISLSNMLLNFYPIEQPQTPLLTSINNKYFYGNVSYRNLLNKRWSFMTGVAVTRNIDQYRPESDLIDEDLTGGHAKISFFGDISSHLTFSTGVELIVRESAQQFVRGSDGFVNQWGFNESLIGGFAEAEYFFSNNLVARVGARIEISNLDSNLFVSPRASLAYKVSENGQFSIATGNYRQAAQDKYLWVANHLDYEKANHYIINYQFLNSNRTFRVETYYKQYKNLVKYDSELFYDPSVYKNSGSGFAKGVDLFWRDSKTIKNADYWVSYSYLDTERDYQNYPYAARPEFSSKHNLSVVYKHFVSALKTQFSGTYTFGSGRPYNDPNTTDFNAGITPQYHDLSLSISYLAAQNLIIHGSVTNVFGRDNIFGYEYSEQPNTKGFYDGRAITLPAPRFIFVGIFLTLSKQQTLNQMQSL